jgi:hypothetical protein
MGAAKAATRAMRRAKRLNIEFSQEQGGGGLRRR